MLVAVLPIGQYRRKQIRGRNRIEPSFGGGGENRHERREGERFLVQNKVESHWTQLLVKKKRKKKKSDTFVSLFVFFFSKE